MEKFEISVTADNENHHFEVIDYMHHDGVKCKFEVFQNGKFIASFEPGAHKHLQICKDPQIINEALLNRIADQIESYHL